VSGELSPNWRSLASRLSLGPYTSPKSFAVAGVS